MDAHILEWLGLVARWIHVIVGIAWIGTSFYFNWLNDQLPGPNDGVLIDVPGNITVTHRTGETTIAGLITTEVFSLAG